jgi:hypothetical protein
MGRFDSKNPPESIRRGITVKKKIFFIIEELKKNLSFSKDGKKKQEKLFNKEPSIPLGQFF